MASTLETALLEANPHKKHAEHEIDILRDILAQNLGTQAQRASLIRMIREYSPRRSPMSRLHQDLNMIAPNRSTYTNS